MAQHNAFTKESISLQLEQLYKDIFSFDFEEYIGLKQKINVTCLKCGSEFEQSFQSLLYEKHNNRCSVCLKDKRDVAFKDKVKSMYGDEYIPLTKYNTCKDKIKFIHNKNGCMNEFWVTPDGFINAKNGCPKCRHREGADKLFISDAVFKERIEKIHKGHIVTLSPYKGNKNPVKIKHNDCGRIFETNAGDLLQGKGCRYCNGGIKKTTESYKEDIYRKYGNEYTVIGEYINAKTNIRVRHNLCGCEWDVNPGTIMRRRTCPNCNNSYGEFEIKNFCEYNNLEYKEQYTFDDLKLNDYLRFDFAIFNSGCLKCLIEYDGKAHFHPVMFGGIQKSKAEENLEELKYRDNMKDDYCKRNNIPLLRIKYDNTDYIKQNLIPFIYDNVGLNCKVPDMYVVNKLKSNKVNFIDYLDTLPNGIYSKTDLRNNIVSNKKHLCSIYKDETIILYCKNNFVTIHPKYIEINRPGKYCYGEYVTYGIEHNYDFPQFIFIKNTILLTTGSYEKGKIHVDCSNHYNRMNYVFIKKYICDRNMNISGRYVQIKNSEEEVA